MSSYEKDETPILPPSHEKSDEYDDSQWHNIVYGETKGWTKKISSFSRSIPGVINHHAREGQWWNKFFVIAFLFGVFLDPLFFFLLSVEKKNKCIVIDQTMTTTLAVLRSMTDFIYLLYILLQYPQKYRCDTFDDSRIKHAQENLCGYLCNNYLDI